MIIIDGIIFSLQRQGGVSVYFQSLITYLAEIGEPTMVVLEHSRKQELILDGKSVQSCYASSRLLERYRTCRIYGTGTVFHSSYYRRPVRSDIPTVVTVHDFVYERFLRGPRQLIHTLQKNAAIRAAQAVICVSESTKSDLLEFVGETPGQMIHVIHNGVSGVFRILGLEASGRPYVLFVGQRGGYKNFRLAVDALEFLPGVDLVCVGGGPVRPNELDGVSAAVVARVRHLGYVTDENLNILYNQACCLIYPSSYEGFGIPLLEAMRAGCPVVVGNCKALREVGRDALIVAIEYEARSMADAVMISVSSKRSILIEKGLNVALNYSWQNTHGRTFEVYRGLAER